jgi:hypothetical protein
MGRQGPCCFAAAYPRRGGAAGTALANRLNTAAASRPAGAQPVARRRPATRRVGHSVVARRASSAARAISAPGADERAVLSLCEQLSAACGGRVDRYQACEPALFAEVLREVAALEAAASFGTGAGFKAASLERAMVGRWLLLLTDSAVVVKNGGGLIGLPIPGAHCTGVEVLLDARGAAATVESLRLGFINASSSLLGKWSLVGKAGRLLEVTYAEAVVLGGPKLRADTKAVLDTTFLGDRLRVGRSQRGDVYLFRRVLAEINAGEA